MRAELVGWNDFHTHHVTHAGVIVGEALRAAIVDEIGPAVADVRDMELLADDRDGCQGRTHSPAAESLCHLKYAQVGGIDAAP